MVLLRIEYNEVTGWIEANDTHEVIKKLESIFDYDDEYGRQQCIQQLYQIDVASRGKHDLGNGYLLLVY